jgi:FlaA1/EpsC-like NDP-sugar epimerase
MGCVNARNDDDCPAPSFSISTLMYHSLMKYLTFKLKSLDSSLSRQQKRLILTSFDIIFFLVSIYSAFVFRFGFEDAWKEIFKSSLLVLLLLSIKISVFQKMGMYRPILRYTGFEFILTALKAVMISSGTLAVLTYLLNYLPVPADLESSFLLPGSVLINDALLTLLFVAGIRLAMRYAADSVIALANASKATERVVIYGAGSCGSQLAQALAQNHAYRLVAFVDDDVFLHKHVVQGLTVYSPAYLPELKTKKDFDTILLAMPSIDGLRKQEILDNLQDLAVKVKTVPSISEILSGQVSISRIRNIEISDLLGREQVAPVKELLQMDVTDKSVLVTGAGGSIGSELCRQIAKQQPKCLVLYDVCEFALYNMDMELAETYPNLHRVACLGSVTEEAHLSAVLRKYQVDTVYHAAAYKHVPLVEANPAPGILNNVFGTLTAARCASESGVSKFVLISTDKAVRPTNVMGATKRVAELILQALAEQAETTTCFTMVRFGNVLGSSGSVVPRFRQQIAEGKAITLTHPDMTRYFMSIPEAASLVIQAGAMATGGEVFLLDMGEPVRIYDLAMQMIRLSGLEPGKDLDIEITGLRPGEKIYEELLIDTANARRTRQPKIFCAYEASMSWSILSLRLDKLLFYAQHNNYGGILSELQAIVPEYKPFVKVGSELQAVNY